MNIEITLDNLSDGAVSKLLDSHLEEMQKYSPPESVHALDIEALRKASITFWVARIDGKLAGCGALKEVAPDLGEIKSMKTDARFLRKGVAAKILEMIIEESVRRSYQILYLETGSNAAFWPATAMYRKYGFEECGPFGEYKLDPYSLYLSKTIDQQ